MSLRIAGDKLALRRTTNLPASFAAFTIIMAVKQIVARPTHSAYLAYMQQTGGANAEGLVLKGTNGDELFGSDAYEANFTASVATLPIGGAAGTNWRGVAIRGSAAGAGGLKVYHKPIGGGGSLVSQTVTNTPGTGGFEALNIGDAAFNAGDFGVPGWWPDVCIAHLKIYDRALSDAEVEAEMGSATVVSSTGLITYHSFSNANIATAVVPDTGTGTFDYYTSAPSMSTDMPVYSSVNTLTLLDTLPSTGGSLAKPTPPAIVSRTVTGARTIALTFTAGTGTIDGYRVYAQKSGSAPFLAGTAAPGQTSVVASGLTPNTGYALYMASHNGAGESSPSASVSNTTFKVKVRATKLESTIAAQTGLRMIVWLAPSVAGETVGEKVGEITNITAGPAVFDATESANVCAADADCSAIANVDMIPFGTPVRVHLSKDSVSRSTRIVAATVVEEA
jgi:hypothetical protein